MTSEPRRPESTTVRLTPSQMARLRAAGWEPGAGPLDEWLVRRVEQLLKVIEQIDDDSAERLIDVLVPDWGADDEG